MAALFSKFISWFFTAFVFKTVIFLVIYVSLSFVLPLVFKTIIQPFLSDLSQGSIGGDLGMVGFFLEPFHIDVGINLMLSSYSLRFIIRRIPFIN